MPAICYCTVLQTSVSKTMMSLMVDLRDFLRRWKLSASKLTSMWSSHSIKLSFQRRKDIQGKWIQGQHMISSSCVELLQPKKHLLMTCGIVMPAKGFLSRYEFHPDHISYFWHFIWKSLTFFFAIRKSEVSSPCLYQVLWTPSVYIH